MTRAPEARGGLICGSFFDRELCGDCWGNVQMCGDVFRCVQKHYPVKNAKKSLRGIELARGERWLGRLGF